MNEQDFAAEQSPALHSNNLHTASPHPARPPGELRTS